MIYIDYILSAALSDNSKHYCQIYFALLSAKKRKFIQDIMYCVHISRVYA